MAGNGDRESVRSARAGNRAHRLRVSDTPCYLGIGNRLANGNLLKCLPHALLKRGAAHVERKIQTDSGRFDAVVCAGTDAVMSDAVNGTSARARTEPELDASSTLTR